MFRNLYEQVHTFADFNYSDLLGQLEIVSGQYLKRATRDYIAGAEFDPFYQVVPALPLTLLPVSCAAYIRSYPELPICERDYYLSKLYQFGYYALAAKLPHNPDNRYELEHNDRVRLENVVDEIPDFAVVSLSRFDFWDFCWSISRKRKLSRCMDQLTTSLRDFVDGLERPEESPRYDGGSIQFAKLRPRRARSPSKAVRLRNEVILRAHRRDATVAETCDELDKSQIPTTTQMHKKNIYTWIRALQHPTVEKNVYTLMSKVRKRA
jgi:hypothetical protein